MNKGSTSVSLQLLLNPIIKSKELFWSLVADGLGLALWYVSRDNQILSDNRDIRWQFDDDSEINWLFKMPG